MEERPGHTMKNPSDVASGIVILCLCAIGAISTIQLPKGIELFGPRALPLLSLTIVAGGSAILVWRGLVNAKHKPVWGDLPALRKTGLYLLCFLIYLLALAKLGGILYYIDGFPFRHSFVFCITTMVFLAFSLKFLGRTSRLETALVSLISPAALFCIFTLFFKVYLP
jgi:hypothetical protein